MVLIQLVAQNARCYLLSHLKCTNAPEVATEAFPGKRLDKRLSKGRVRSGWEGSQQRNQRVVYRLIEHVNEVRIRRLTSKEQPDAVKERVREIIFDAASGKVRIKPPDGSARDEAEATGRHAGTGRRKPDPRRR